MTRGELSSADRELTRQLAQRGLRVSAAQLERWRRAGLLPANVRRALGRGRGSVSVPADGAQQTAAALARHAAPGRDLRWTVLAWYAEAGHPVLPGHEPVPEPPGPAVRAALLWAVERDRIRRLRAAARSAGTDAELDAWYAAAEQVLRRGGGRAPHPDQIRTMLLHPPAGPALVHLLAATALGPDEVGAGALTGALTALALPGGHTAGTGHPEAGSGAGADPAVALDRQLPALSAQMDLRDPLHRAAATGESDLADARQSALTLAGIGGLYLAHGLLMPDTPALAALRRTLDDAGLGEFTRQAFTAITTPSGIARLLVACLDPHLARLAAGLRDLAADHAGQHGMLHRPGHDSAAYGRDWLEAINALTTADAAPHTVAGDSRPAEAARNGRPPPGGEPTAAARS